MDGFAMSGERKWGLPLFLLQKLEGKGSRSSRVEFSFFRVRVGSIEETVRRRIFS